MEVRVPIKEKYIGHGILHFYLDRWDAFSRLVNERLLDYPTFAYRGHAEESWRLRSTLDRLIDRTPASHETFDLLRHLENFKLAVRGRRGPHPQPLQHENEWWALGQHFGLATPLIDWSDNPYVAAFFAFEHERNEHKDTPKRRIVFGIEKDLHKYVSGENQPTTSRIEFVQPFTDDNARLVNQRGLFTKLPPNMDLENALGEEIAKDCEQVLLIKIFVPEGEGDRCRFLQALNRMNVNALTLFPDVGGASQYCNCGVLIPNY